MANAAIPEFLATYLAQRDAARADAVDSTLASLTDRERALVKEAAVMGYVQGMRHPQGEAYPKDSQVLALVIDACLAFSDLYPTISGEADTEPAPDFFQPGHSYTHRDGTTFRCIAVADHPSTGAHLALGWHTDLAGVTYISYRDINQWRHEYDGCEPPAPAERAATRGEPGEGQ